MALGNVTLLKFYSRVCHQIHEFRDICDDFKSSIEDTENVVDLFVDNQEFEELFEEVLDIYKENVEFLIDELDYLNNLTIEEVAFEESFEKLDEITKGLQTMVYDVESLFTSLETFLEEGTEEALEKVQNKQMEAEEHIFELKKVCKEVYYNYFEKIQSS